MKLSELIEKLIALQATVDDIECKAISYQMKENGDIDLREVPLFGVEPFLASDEKFIALNIKAEKVIKKFKYEVGETIYYLANSQIKSANIKEQRPTYITEAHSILPETEVFKTRGDLLAHLMEKP